MPSLRKPKRVAFLCSDQVERNFLVKGGEDLRQDQRIQLLFAVMNGILSQSAPCKARELSMRTFAVCPLSDNVGLIEWMDGTSPLKSVIGSAYKSDSGVPLKGKERLKALVDDGLDQQFIADKMRLNEDYLKAMAKAPNDRQRKFERLQQSVPDSLLREGVAKLAISSEAYLSMRSLFARSLAVLTASSYLLGVGDRHLDNFMMEQATGRVVGIDFGHAFGSATYILPVPELMGVRLTRQMTAFLRPLDSGVLLKSHMRLALAAIRERKGEVLRVMEVFLSEPLVDWEMHARKLTAEQKEALIDEAEEAASLATAVSASQVSHASNAAAAGGATEAWAWKRLEGARAKLDGANPAYITVSEAVNERLQAWPASMPKLKQSITDLVLGPDGSLRRQLGDVRGLTVEQQVDALVEQATDTNILSRTWRGWAPWL